MKNVRLGIVGLGNIGKFHTGYLLDNKISRCTLTAVSDAYAPRLKPLSGSARRGFLDYDMHLDFDFCPS